MTFQYALKILANLHLLDHELLRRADIFKYISSRIIASNTLGAKNTDMHTFPLSTLKIDKLSHKVPSVFLHYQSNL